MIASWTGKRKERHFQAQQHEVVARPPDVELEGKTFCRLNANNERVYGVVTEVKDGSARTEYADGYSAWGKISDGEDSLWDCVVEPP